MKNLYSELAKFFGSGAVTLISKVVSSLAVLCLSYLVVRRFGEVEAGKFFYALSVLALVSVVARLGFESVYIRDIASASVSKDQEKLSRTLLAPTISVVLFASLLTLSFYTLIHVFNWQSLNANFSEEAERFLLFSILPHSLLVCTACICLGLRQPSRSVLLQMALPPAIVILVLLWLPNLHVESLYRVQWVAYLAALVFGLALTFTSIPKNALDIRYLKALSGVSIPFYLINMASVFQLWAPTALLGIIGEPREIAAYAICQRLAMIVSFPLLAVNYVFAPYLSSVRHNSSDELLRLLRLSIVVSLAFSFPLIVGMIFFSGNLLSFFSSGFDTYSIVLVILCIAQLVAASFGSLDYLMQMRGYEGAFAKIIQYSLPLLLLACWAGYSLNGAVGLALGVCATLTVQKCFTAASARKLMTES